MIPGEYILSQSGPIEANTGLLTQTLRVANTGDRPIQIGSHFHFFEVNTLLNFERQAALGFRLNIPAGTAIRFEPGDTRDLTYADLLREVSRAANALESIGVTAGASAPEHLVEELAGEHCAGGGIALIASHQSFTLPGMDRLELARHARRGGLQ